MNTKDLEKVYQKIALQLNNIIPESWEKVMLYSEVDEYSDSTVFFYYAQNESKPIYCLDIEDMAGVNEDEVDEQLNGLDCVLRELWDEFKRNKQELWTSLTFELYSTGKFEIEYDYTIVEKYNHFERLIIWKYEKLGIMHKEERVSDTRLIREYIETKKESLDRQNIKFDYVSTNNEEE